IPSDIIFIPGLQTSRLFVKEGDTLNKVWEPNRNLDLEKLHLDAQGKSIQDVLVGDPIEKITVHSIKTPISIYDEFFTFLDTLEEEKTISHWEAFPYDWRKNLEDIVSEPVQKTDGTS